MGSGLRGFLMFQEKNMSRAGLSALGMSIYPGKMFGEFCSNHEGRPGGSFSC
jgi:hypothetical protein